MKKLTMIAKPEHRGLRLDQLLATWLPEALARPISKAAARKLIVAGAVYLNGKRIRIASKLVLPGARLDAYVDLEKLLRGGATDDRFEMADQDILFEDEDLIAVNKPAKLPTQPTLDESRDNLFAAVKRFLTRREGGDPYLGLHHRLDKETSGVVLFTKTRRANAGISEAFSGHQAAKTYLAITERPPGVEVPSQFAIKNHLGRAQATGKKARFTAVRSGGDYAHTDFKVLDTFSQAMLIEARPKTGRTHQIRVHLSEFGIPILGDAHYGAKAGRAPRIMLHAASLTLPHPVHQTEICIQSPVPEDFSTCLQAQKT